MGFSLSDMGAPTKRARPKVEWEECNCLLCGGCRLNPLVEAPDHVPGNGGLWFLVVQCQDCGLCFTNPRPSRDSIGLFYPEAYTPHLKTEWRLPRRWWRGLFGWWDGSAQYRKVLPLHGLGRLLDFGCGGGSYLHRMHHQGWQVTGLDCSARAIELVSTEHGYRALLGSLPHPELRGERFDVITMWQSLEHVHAPLEVLGEANRLLVPGGRVIISVPNIDSLPFRWFGHAWYGLDLPRHLVHFSPWTLHLMLRRAGFRVGPIQMVRHSKWLRSSAKRACRVHASTSRWHNLLRGKATAHLVCWYSWLTRQTDCITVAATKR
jgi:2-polyprenyl-3-methyl-5-hydroxy-6-metoxy-1,4-benzoquinol methylase